MLIFCNTFKIYYNKIEFKRNLLHVFTMYPLYIKMIQRIKDRFSLLRTYYPFHNTFESSSFVIFVYFVELSRLFAKHKEVRKWDIIAPLCSHFSTWLKSRILCIQTTALSREISTYKWSSVQFSDTNTFQSVGDSDWYESNDSSIL